MFLTTLKNVLLEQDDKNKKLISKIKEAESMSEKAAKSAARAEILLTEEAGFIEPTDSTKKTFKISQKELKEAVDMNAARKSFELVLEELGPYKVEYTSNGKHALLYGQRGHIAMFDWKKKKLAFELKLNQTIRDAKYLHRKFLCTLENF